MRLKVGAPQLSIVESSSLLLRIRNEILDSGLPFIGNQPGVPMNAIRNSLLLAALCFVIAPAAHAQQSPPNPAPATSETEGTAADRTAPNPTATRPVQPGQVQTDPRPSTHPAEGTAADRTPPGKTPTTTPGTTPTQASAQLVGAAVVTPSGTSIGKVVDVVFDSVAQQPAFVVIASENGQAAVPYSVASSMKSGDKVVMDQSRLKSAPKVKNEEWRRESGSHWQQESSKYWEQSGG
jgi:sporulation protein YlmC with PRC-barrel domain